MSEIFRPLVTKIATLGGHRDAVYALAGGAGNTVYSGSADGMVVGWDTADPARDGELLARVQNSVYALRHLPALNMLALGHNFQGVQVLDLDGHQLVQATALPPVAIFEMFFLSAVSACTWPSEMAR